MICPNFNNPVEVRQFQDMEVVFGNQTAKWLWHENNGYPLTKTRTGEDSKLFRELLEFTGNEKTAMLVKAQIYKTVFTAEPTMNELLNRVIKPADIKSKSIYPETLTYNDVRKALIDKAIGENVTGKRVIRGQARNVIICRFADKQTSYRVAERIMNKINGQLGQGAATLDTTHPLSVSVYIVPSDKKIKQQLNTELGIAKDNVDQQRTDESWLRQQEGSWKVNEEGDVVPLDEYDFTEYLPATAPVGFNETFDDLVTYKVDVKEKLVKLLQNLKKQSKIRGSEQLGKKIADVSRQIHKLNQEIESMKRQGVFISTIETASEKDFQRVEKLINAGDPISLIEAKKILEFWVTVDSHEPRINRLFFDDSGSNTMSIDKAPDNIKESLTKIAFKANSLDSALLSKMKDVAYDRLINHPNYAKTYENGTTLEEMFKNIKDIDMLSQLFLNPDFRFGGDDSILAQLIKQMFEDKLVTKIKIAGEIIEEIDASLPAVNKRLIEIGEFRRSWIALRHGIPRQKVPLYTIFYQKTSTGDIKPYLLNKFSQAWHELKSEIGGIESDGWKLGQDFDTINRRKYFAVKNRARLLDIRKLEYFKNHKLLQGKIGNDIQWASQAEMDAYKQELIDQLGVTTFNELVEEQESKIINYLELYSKLLEEESEKVPSGSTLPPDAQLRLKAQRFQRSPFKAYDIDKSGNINSTYNELDPATGKIVQKPIAYTNTLEFNIYIPRADGIVYEADGKTSMGSAFNPAYTDMENNEPVLFEFLQTLTKAAKYINEAVPKTGRNATSILAMNRSFFEAVIDPRVGQKREFYKILKLDKLTKDAFINYFSSKNDDFDDKPVDETVINSAKFKDINRNISQKTQLHVVLLSHILGHNIDSKTSVKIDSSTDTKIISFFADLLGVNHSPSAIITAIAGSPQSSVEFYAGKLIRSTVEKNEMIQQTLNLPKVMKFYLAQAAHYDAANEIAPQLVIFKRLYSELRNEKGVKGGRERANKRLNRWFDRVVRQYYTNSKPKGGLRLLTSEEKEEAKKLQILIDNAQTQEEKSKWIKRQEALGGVVNYNTIWNAINSFIIFSGLAFNLRSSIFNYLYGATQSLFIDQTGEYWTPGNFHAAFNFVLGKGRKNFYKATYFDIPSGKGKKIHVSLVPNWKNHAQQILLAELFINKVRIIQDMRNEKQKASTNLGKKELAGTAKNMLRPFHISVTAVEWRNQTADILAVLMDIKIKDNNGNEVQIFDGNKFNIYEDVEGKLKLKAEFRTKENIENWEEFGGEQFMTFRRIATSAIQAAQGDYSPTGGMMIKEWQAGKTAMMFNTWFPMMLWRRFGKGVNLATGLKRENTIYSAHNPYTLATLFGVGTAVGIGGIGTLSALATGGLGALLGLSIGFFMRGYMKKLLDVRPEVGILKELLLTFRFLGMKTIGLPVNMLINFLPANVKFSRDFLEPNIAKHYTKVSPEDVRAMHFIMQEIAVVLNVVMMKIAITAMLHCEEETPVCERRMKIKNFLDNSLTRIMYDVMLYINPITMVKNIVDGSFLSFFEKIWTLTEAIGKYIDGDDIIATGEYVGESRLLRNIDKTLVPSVLSLNHAIKLFDGTAKQAVKSGDTGQIIDYAMPHQEDRVKRDFVDMMFTSAEKKADINITRRRTRLRTKLRKKGYSENFIQDEVNRKYPTLKGKAKELAKNKSLTDFQRKKLYEKYIDEMK